MTVENIEKIVNECGVNLYDTESLIENERKIFRIYITCESGITIDKCADVSKILSPLFDLNPPVSGDYFLEVSSPGIERKLKEIKHYKASVGEIVRIKLENNEKYQGKIISCNEDNVEIEINTKEKIYFKYSDIIKAKIYFKW